MDSSRSSFFHYLYIKRLRHEGTSCRKELHNAEVNSNQRVSSIYDLLRNKTYGLVKKFREETKTLDRKGELLIRVFAVAFFRNTQEFAFTPIITENSKHLLRQLLITEVTNFCKYVTYFESAGFFPVYV